jgi:hypothetical protein
MARAVSQADACLAGREQSAQGGDCFHCGISELANSALDHLGASLLDLPAKGSILQAPV